MDSFRINVNCIDCGVKSNIDPHPFEESGASYNQCIKILDLTTKYERYSALAVCGVCVF